MYRKPELIIEDEVYDLLYTDKDYEPINEPMIHRQYRRNDKLELIYCNACNTKKSNEGILDCPYCKGTGKLFDERIIKGFIYRLNYPRERYNLIMPRPVGKNDQAYGTLITDSKTIINAEDRIFTLRLNENGTIQIPIIHIKEHTAYYSTHMKGSSSRRADFNLTILWD